MKIGKKLLNVGHIYQNIMNKTFKFEKPIRLMKPTTDNWSPNFENNMVLVSYIGKLTDGNFRVCVWGNNDLGMEYDTKQEKNAKEMFQRLSKKNIITQKKLLKLDFIYA